MPFAGRRSTAVLARERRDFLAVRREDETETHLCGSLTAADRSTAPISSLGLFRFPSKLKRMALRNELPTLTSRNIFLPLLSLFAIIVHKEENTLILAAPSAAMRAQPSRSSPVGSRALSCSRCFRCRWRRRAASRSSIGPSIVLRALCRPNCGLLWTPLARQTFYGTGGRFAVGIFAASVDVPEPEVRGVLRSALAMTYVT